MNSSVFSPRIFTSGLFGGTGASGGGGGNPVTSGLVFELLATDLGGLSTSDPISTWSDHYAGGDFTAADSARPTYRATGGPNSLPCARCDGADDILQSAFSLDMRPATVIIVMKKASTSFDIPYGGTPGNAFLYNWASDSCLQYAGGNIYFNIDPTVWNIITSVYGGADSVARVNGVETLGDCGTSFTVGNSVCLGAWNSSAGYYCAEDVFAFIGYNRGLDITERGDVEAWLNGLTSIF